MNMQNILNAHLDVHRTAGAAWPAEAEFCVVYNQSTWPMGWDKESTVRFFENRANLDAWVATQDKWAQMEDNYIAFQAYEWDLGPNKMDLCTNVDNLSMTHFQRMGL